MAEAPDIEKLLRRALTGKHLPPDIPFSVGGRQYALTFVRNLIIPRRQTQFPVAPVIRLDISADGDQVDTFIENSDSWLTQIRSFMAVSFARRASSTKTTAVPLEEIFLESGDSNDFDETAKASKGVWFHESGIFFPIMADRNNAPLYTLAYYAPVFAKHYPSVQEFVQENPPPRETFDVPKPSPVETEQERKIRQARTKEIRKRQKSQKERMLTWLARLSEKLFEEGWNIIWKGTVHTPSYSLEDFASKLSALPEPAQAILNEWEPEARVDVYYGSNFTSAEDSVSWGYLKTLPYRQSYVSKYSRLFESNKKKVLDLAQEHELKRKEKRPPSEEDE